MQIDKLAEENYRRFCALEGSEYIATEFALFQILRIISIFNIKSILELGLGIGAIADTVLQFSRGSDYDLEYFGTEGNDYCQKELEKNVNDFSRVRRFTSLEEINTENKFDLIIVDGLDQNLEKIVSYCKSRTILFIEGDRSPQAEMLMSIFPRSKQVNVISLKRNREYSHGLRNFFMGGGRVIFIDPDLKMLSFYWKERTKTYLKRRLRNVI